MRIQWFAMAANIIGDDGQIIAVWYHGASPWQGHLVLRQGHTTLTLRGVEHLATAVALAQRLAR